MPHVFVFSFFMYMNVRNIPGFIVFKRHKLFRQQCEKDPTRLWSEAQKIYQSYLLISISNLQNDEKLWPFIEERISMGSPVLIFDQISACTKGTRIDFHPCGTWKE